MSNSKVNANNSTVTMIVSANPEKVKAFQAKVAQEHAARLENFSTVKREFENAYKVNRDNCHKQAYALGLAVVYSTYNAVHRASGNDRIIRLKIDTAKAWEDICNGSILDTLGDSFDLVQDAVERLLWFAENCATVDNWLDRPLEHTKVNGHVVQYGKAPEWVTVDTTPIQEVFAYVRSKISAHSSIQALSKYSYISEYVELDDNGEENPVFDQVFYRSGKYADVGGQTVDGTGVYTADMQTLFDTEKAFNDLCERANLTEGQRETLYLYAVNGYGVKQLARRYGTTRQAIQNRLNKIREKVQKTIIVSAG